MNIPITQSKDWQKLQEDLGEKSYLITEKDYHFLAIEKNTPFGKYLYLPYGPVADDKQGIKDALNALTKLSEENNYIFIRIEPQLKGALEKLQYNLKKTKDLNPKETWILDLTGNEEELKSRLPSRLLRYYKSAENKGITIKSSKDPNDIKYLIILQNELAKEKGINTFSEDYLRTEAAQPFATTYLVEYNNPETNKKEIIAAGLVFDDKTTRYNLQGAQSDTGRKLHATGILTIQLIYDAKEKGQRIFDFWGIAPEGAPADHPWAGFTNFKKTFSGREVDYTGTYDIVINSLKYQLYTVFRKLNRFVRHV